jgi:hypothetical protein
MERLMKVLVVLVVMACVAPAMATWYGGVLWTGASDNDFLNSANWDGAMDNEWKTVGLMAKTLSGTGAPVINGSANLGELYVKGVTVNQTGGDIVWQNGTGGNLCSVAVFRSGILNISGGSMEAQGVIGVGFNTVIDNNTGNLAFDPSGTINLTGDAVLKLTKNVAVAEPYLDTTYGLYMNDGTKMYISDNAKFIMDVSFWANYNYWISNKGSNWTDIMAGYIANGFIVNPDGKQIVATDLGGGLMQYSVVPEPATLALLGLGALVLRRKR